MTDPIRSMAQECLSLSARPRPEQEMLKEFCIRLQLSCGISRKSDLDRLLAERMTAAPASASEVLKVRYWRTGRHIPGSRALVLRFGEALNLRGEEMTWMLQAWADRSDRVFTEEDRKDPLYQRRKQAMDGYFEEYLRKIHPDRLYASHIFSPPLSPYLRHLYYLDALDYVSGSAAGLFPANHSISANYDAEFRRHLRLFGEIPRTAMIRHLIIAGAPFINEAILSDRLERLGYLPLQEDHTGTGGERYDWLILRLMEWYEKECLGKEPLECSRKLKQACQTLDRVFVECGADRLRILYFKALEKGLKHEHDSI